MSVRFGGGLIGVIGVTYAEILRLEKERGVGGVLSLTKNRPPLDKLHLLHDATKLSSLSNPPNLLGMTWSTVVAS